MHNENGILLVIYKMKYGILLLMHTMKYGTLLVIYAMNLGITMRNLTDESHHFY